MACIDTQIYSISGFDIMGYLLLQVRMFRVIYGYLLLQLWIFITTSSEIQWSPLYTVDSLGYPPRISQGLLG